MDDLKAMKGRVDACPGRSWVIRLDNEMPSRRAPFRAGIKEDNKSSAADSNIALFST